MYLKLHVLKEPLQTKLNYIVSVASFVISFMSLLLA